MIGIENVNEFYTTHYLEAILAGDIAPHLERFKAAAKDEDDAAAPWRRLGRLQQPFFAHLSQLAGLRPADARVRAHHEMAARLLDALGYELRPRHRFTDAGPLPVLGAFSRADGEPLLWLLAAPSAHGAEEGPLARTLLPAQHDLVPDLPLDFDPGAVHERTVEELVTDAFQQPSPPRFVLILGDRDWILADRGKWPEQRLLRFDLERLLGDRDQATLEAVTALLHRETLAPESGTSLVDTLDDSSHKHAYEVSEDLKYALQASIERIGNEAIRYRREVSKQKVYDEEIDAQQLAVECIRYMYRILFLLYVEARPGLGYAPMGSEAYRLGYSFERLRDLEMLELETQEARDGFYVHECLEKLFHMVAHGAGPEQAEDQALFGRDLRARRDLGDGGDGAPGEGSLHHTFRLVPLRSHLFDPERTPFLNRVALRNEVLLEVIRAMSLSKPQGSGRGRRRGRISYATLGINQLGAVYEALLSFRGFFAEETLYEVKPAKADTPDPVRDSAYFVPERDLGRYAEDERVFDDDGQLRASPPGTFIYRMAGRDREKSASYYTPEVLTRCLVKYALKELLEDEDGNPRHERAEDLLELTICEPAMGSAAFLNEAINQLAERYLQRRMKELDERIPHDQYAHELQRVRMYLADNNVYGVDLNPVALELAETSLWLNAIFSRDTAAGREVFVPWFGGQLCCGNSLVGAWRKVYSAGDVDAGEEEDECAWLDAVPERIPLGTPRPEGSVYHFLLPDRGMADYGGGSEGRPIRDMCGDELDAIKAWRRGACAPVGARDRRALVRLSDAVDRLWSKHVELLAEIRRRTTDPLEVYGHEHPLAGQPPTTTRDKDRIWKHEMASEQVRASSPYRRLKLAMDYWCALWFWPIQHAELLPDRDEWLTDMSLLLDSEVLPELGEGKGQRSLFPPTVEREEAKALVDEVGYSDVESLIQRWPRLQLVDELSRRYRFHHWELEFADLFASRGGFDLVLGNPPWVRVEWKEGGILGDFDPSLVLHRLSAAETAKRRADVIETLDLLPAYLAAHEEAAATQEFLASTSNYPELRGVKVNLYKAFLPVGWNINHGQGATAFLHPDGLFEDPRGGEARAAAYRRMRRRYGFTNEKKLFAEVHNETRFSVNVYGPGRVWPRFECISNLFVPSTIDECYSHSGAGPVPGIKDDDNDWEVRGHRSRIIEVTATELELFARLYDEPDTPALEARLPALHSVELVDVLRAFAEAPLRLGDLSDDEYFATFHFNETYAQHDGTIRREVRFPKSVDEWVISGPHFFVGNPLYKTPKAEVVSNKSYDVVDLLEVSEAYLPRTIFVPGVGTQEYRARSPQVPWAEGGGRRSVLDYFRVVVNAGLGPGRERTLQPAICPPGAAHVHAVYSYAFENETSALLCCATWASLPVDFLVKSTGMSSFYPSLARRLPISEEGIYSVSILPRICGLICATSVYSELWFRHFRDAWKLEVCTLLGRSLFDGSAHLSSRWNRSCCIRSPLERRAALVEIDTLVAMALGLDLDELRTAYRAQFYLLREYESDTWYDQHGRIVFTSSVGLPRVGLPRTNSRRDPNPCWNDVQHMAEENGYTGSDTVTQVVMDDTLPGGPREKTIVYQAPWIRCDREKDYEVAWAHFAERFEREEP